MSQLSLDEVKAQLLAALAGTPLDKLVRDVAVEAVVDQDGIDMLRITLTVHKPNHIDSHEALAVVRRLQDIVLESDDRFPSIRFAEAA